MIVKRLLLLAAAGMLSLVAACSGSSHGGTPAPSPHTHSAKPAGGPGGSGGSGGIPQNNGGDHDGDNNGGPSDGDGNV